MASEKPQRRVGVAAIIYRADGKFVTGKRKGSHGAGTWQLPGGHLEHGESVLSCAEREVLEETGLRVRGVKIVAVTNDDFEEVGKHYETMFVRCEMDDQAAEPEVLEPNKCEGWYWKTWDDLKQMLAALEQGESESQGEKLFLPLVHLLQQTPDLDGLRL
ncbi:NUDIX hydrolase domain-like protein [Dactylonectria estremocensis]|uniref:NUDIX hydrolase domain-like protein n=1 Tax=Dactylonectria estremocensis TaxID=1079267 RepID=A0A9P9DN12_9HYPO|nr:NUDIX hydrolase domain-like protein [Dactylonectria estremocensis]